MILSEKLNLKYFVTYLEVFIDPSENKNFGIVCLVKLAGAAIIADQNMRKLTEADVELVW